MEHQFSQMLQKDLHKLYKWADANNIKLNANNFELLRYGKEQEIKSATAYKSYDDSNIDNNEQVRDLLINMSNTATFTVEIRKYNLNGQRQNGMGVESVSVAEVLSHADTVEISCHSSTRELQPALESMESKSHTIFRRYSTNVYIQNL